MPNFLQVTLAAFLLIQCFSVPAIYAAEVVALTVCEMPNRKQDDESLRPVAFNREMVRQGFLIVAREDFGLLTRDEALGESFETEPKATVFELNVSHTQGKHISFDLLMSESSIAKADAPYAYRHDRSALASIAKSVVFDFRDEYTEALKKAGFKPKRIVATEPSKEKLSEIDDAMKHMSVFAQYHAARICHAELVAKGQSAEVIGRLARCYANLSQLTTHYLTNMRAVFAARAVIYATELLRLYPDDPTGYWNQAYAFSILGLSKDSMWQLARIEDQAELAHASRPDWMNLVELANEFNFASLSELSRRNGKHQELATLLMYRSAECCGSQSLSLEAGKDALQAIPSCLRILHGMDRIAGVRLRHVTTEIPGQLLASILSPALQPLRKDELLAPVLPEDGEAAMVTDQRIALVKALKDVSKKDTAEPSAAVLGRIVENLDCLHVAMRINFLQYNLGTDPSDYAKESRELFERHRFADLFELYAIGFSDVSQKSIQMKKIPLLDANFLSSRLLISGLPQQARLKDRTVGELYAYIHYSSSAFEPDYTTKMDKSSGESKLIQAKYMSDIHPNSPKRTATMVELDWEYASSRIERWLKASNRHPTLVSALATHYEGAGDLKRAESYWDESIASAPDYKNFLGLARLQYRRGAKEAALRTAEAFLEEEDYGLGHAALSDKVAHTLMVEGDFEAALPWAERSGSSYAGWALQTLGYCHFKLGSPEKTAAILTQIDEQYFDDSLYVFNIQTGRSKEEFEQAWKFREAKISRYAADDLSRPFEIGIHEIITGETKKATTTMLKAATEDTAPIHLIYLAAAQHFAGQIKERDDTLKIISEYQIEDDDFAEVAKMVANFIQDDAVDLPILKTAALKLKDSEQDKEFYAANFFVGLMYECLKDDARAIKHYKACAMGNHDNTILLACHRLRELKASVPEWRIKLAGLQE